MLQTVSCLYDFALNPQWVLRILSLKGYRVLLGLYSYEVCDRALPLIASLSCWMDGKATC